LNPPLPKEIPLDAKSKVELATLRSSTEEWLKMQETLRTLTRMTNTLQKLEHSERPLGTVTSAEEGVPPTAASKPEADPDTAEPEPEPEPEPFDAITPVEVDSQQAAGLTQAEPEPSMADPEPGTRPNVDAQRVSVAHMWDSEVEPEPALVVD
jgi:hypothetical protein